MNNCVHKVILFFKLLLIILVKCEKSGEWTILTANAEPYYLNIGRESQNKQFANSISRPIGTCNTETCNVTNQAAHNFNTPKIIGEVIRPILEKNNATEILIHKIGKICSSYHDLLRYSDFYNGYYFVERRYTLYIWDADPTTSLQNCYKGYARESISNDSKMSIIFELENSSYTLTMREKHHSNLWITEQPALFLTNDSSTDSYYSSPNYYSGCEGFFYITHFKFFTVKRQQSNNVTNFVIIGVCVSFIIIISGIIFFFIFKKMRDNLISEDYIEPHLYETPKFSNEKVHEMTKRVPQTQNHSVYDYVYVDTKSKNPKKDLQKPKPPAKPSKSTQQSAEDLDYDYAYATFKKHG